MNVTEFLNLADIRLGEYVDEFEKHEKVERHREEISSLLNRIENLSLDHSIYVLRWSFQLNLPKAFDQSLSIISDESISPSAKLSIVRSMREAQSITRDQMSKLKSISPSLPDNLWTEALSKINVAG